MHAMYMHGQVTQAERTAALSGSKSSNWVIITRSHYSGLLLALDKTPTEEPTAARLTSYHVYRKVGMCLKPAVGQRDCVSE